MEQAPEASQVALRRVVVSGAAREREPVVDARIDGALTAPAIRRRFAAQPIHHNGHVGRNLLDSERADQAEDQREFGRARIVRRLS
jgi:hypothetical protein